MAWWEMYSLMCTHSKMTTLLTHADKETLIERWWWAQKSKMLKSKWHTQHGTKWKSNGSSHHEYSDYKRRFLCFGETETCHGASPQPDKTPKYLSISCSNSMLTKGTTDNQMKGT